MCFASSKNTRPRCFSSPWGMPERVADQVKHDSMHTKLICKTSARTNTKFPHGKLQPRNILHLLPLCVSFVCRQTRVTQVIGPVASSLIPILLDGSCGMADTALGPQDSVFFFFFVCLFVCFFVGGFLQSSTQPHESAARPLQRAAGHIKGTRPPC